MIVDEEGHLRVRGKNETDHNTLLMTLKINDTRKPTYINKWNLDNNEGWKAFNNQVAEAANQHHITQGTYDEAIKRIIQIMKQTVGEKRIRTDKVKRVKNEEINKLRDSKKVARKNFEEACKEQNSTKIMETKTKYMESQKKLRKAIEKEETNIINNKLQNLVKRAKINPNIIWETRKRAKGCNGLEYNTLKEDGRRITDPQETKDHIADYFEDLYQAREGTEEYDEWTKEIKTTAQAALKNHKPITEKDSEISNKEFNTVIKKLQRKKSLGPDKIPNEIFIEANLETRKTLKTMIERAHRSEVIPHEWEEGEIIRLYKGKGVKGKCSNERGIILASNVGKVYERIINERVKKKIHITKAQAGGKAGSSTADHLIVLKQAITEITKTGKTAYIIFLDVQKAYDKAWLDAIIYTLHKNGIEGKNLRMIKKLNSNLTAKIQTRYGLTRKIKIRDSIRQGGVLSVIEYAALIDEISKELRQVGLGMDMGDSTTLDSLLWMDDVCLIHHDLETLQKMLDVTNHVALKYHIQFGAAKCKVIRKGKGKKSNLKLNGEVLDEVPTYKYLGETINNKGNLSDHIKEVESKIRGATAKIIAETGNKEFKGIKMKAVWQMLDAIIIPIITYACEGWTLKKEELKKLQSIFNEALKTILYLPNGTPTTILLNETGNYPVEYIIKKKQVLHAKRIDSMQNESLIKDITSSKNNEWRKEINKITEELNVKDLMAVMSKECLKRHLQGEINTKIMDVIEYESETMTKIKHWKDRKMEIKVGKRPEYMKKLTRKQCNAIIKTRASMLPVKNNFKKGSKTDNQCRFCKMEKETQEHIIQECPKMTSRRGMSISYNDIFRDDVEKLREAANVIIAIQETLSEAETSPKSTT